jgi:translation initiation factor 3 subunit L
MRDCNVQEVHSIYENSFNKLTDRYYKLSPWPPAEAISPLVDNDQQFLLLYKELYYRHIYSKLQPTLEQRIESWLNYCDIFNLLLNAEEPVSLELPNQWIWDIVDEFIYQFQAFCQFRSRVKNKLPEEIKALKAASQVWSVHKVLYYLHAFVEKSKIKEVLKGEAAVSSPFATSRLYRMLGYFSLVGLLRMHCLLADYRLALQTVEGIDLAKKGLFTRVTACHISVFYYVGWAYLMMRRYPDAIKTFSNILFYIGRTKQYHTRSYQYEHILKKNEQMFGLLAIAVSMSPQQQTDDNLLASLREKFADRMSRMQSNHVDLAAYEELFAFACPKFVSPSPPDYDNLPANYNPQEAYRLQLKLFLAEVQQQKLLPTIRSFLKLYTTIGIPKLAALLEADEATFREHLQCLKHKTHALTWTGGPPLSGTWTSCADVDFYVDGEMAHVADFSVTRKHSDYFVKQINKLEEIICNLK